jgi:hypothetical protein
MMYVMITKLEDVFIQGDFVRDDDDFDVQGIKIEMRNKKAIGLIGYKHEYHEVFCHSYIWIIPSKEHAICTEYSLFTE